MEKDELILLLKFLANNPACVKELLDFGVSTNIYDITTECMGACVKITFFNKSYITVDIADEKEHVAELFDEIRKAATEFGLYILRDSISSIPQPTE